MKGTQLRTEQAWPTKSSQRQPHGHEVHTKFCVGMRKKTCERDAEKEGKAAASRHSPRGASQVSRSGSNAQVL
eukprot:2197817-Rhodomonas_salina.2